MNFMGISYRNGYLQTWALASRINRRAPWLGRFLRRACGKLTGHCTSKTEWGYGGGKLVDVYCRWCNEPGTVEVGSGVKQFHDLRNVLWAATGHDINQGPWTPKDDASS